MNKVVGFVGCSKNKGLSLLFLQTSAERLWVGLTDASDADAAVQAAVVAGCCGDEDSGESTSNSSRSNSCSSEGVEAGLGTGIEQV